MSSASLFSKRGVEAVRWIDGVEYRPYRVCTTLSDGTQWRSAVVWVPANRDRTKPVRAVKEET